MAGQDSTCWHAEALKTAIAGLSEHDAELSLYLRVAADMHPHAVDVLTFRGAASVAFDGVIYSPVVATRRRLIKCIAVGCRSSQRRCHHAALVRKLDRLTAAGGDDEDVSDSSSDEEVEGMKGEEDDDEGFIEEELVTISKERQKWNLVACSEEDRQGMMWARTAEFAAMAVPAAAVYSPAVIPADGLPEVLSKPPTLVHRMAELGLAYDPSVVVCEKRCFKCGAQRPIGATSVEAPAVLYTDENAAAPLDVCLFYFSSCTLQSCDRFVRAFFVICSWTDAGRLLLLCCVVCAPACSFLALCS